MIELFVATGNPWQWVDLTELTGAPLPVQRSLAGYDWLNGNTKQLVYGDEQGHVIELWGGFGANGIMRSYVTTQVGSFGGLQNLSSYHLFLKERQQRLIQRCNPGKLTAYGSSGYTKAAKRPTQINTRARNKTIK